MSTEFRLVYVTEVLISKHPTDKDLDEWRVIGTHDSVTDAVRQAEDPEEKRNTRVRQFKERYIPRDNPLDNLTKLTEEARGYDKELVPLVPFYCPTCPGQVASAFQTSSPRCKACKQPMFQGTPNQPIKDL